VCVCVAVAAEGGVKNIASEVPAPAKGERAHPGRGCAHHDDDTVDTTEGLPPKDIRVDHRVPVRGGMW
jgi:hypothetical protein